MNRYLFLSLKKEKKKKKGIQLSNKLQKKKKKSKLHHNYQIYPSETKVNSIFLPKRKPTKNFPKSLKVASSMVFLCSCFQDILMSNPSFLMSTKIYYFYHNYWIIKKKKNMWVKDKVYKYIFFNFTRNSDGKFFILSKSNQPSFIFIKMKLPQTFV